jgi:peroxin-1
MPLHPDVDLKAIARLTDDFSGADLQALMYNAHLEVVHSAISSHSNNSNSSDRESQQEDERIEYTIISEEENPKVMTRAEENAMQQRVRGCTRAPQKKSKSRDS